MYTRLTGNWLELSVRFVIPARAVGGIACRISRQVLRDLDAAGIGIDSATYEIVGLPALRAEHDRRQPTSGATHGGSAGVNDRERQLP